MSAVIHTREFSLIATGAGVVKVPIGVRRRPGSVIGGEVIFSVFKASDLSKQNGWRGHFNAYEEDGHWIVDETWERWLHKPGPPTMQNPTVVDDNGVLSFEVVGSASSDLRWVGVVTMGAQESDLVE